VTVGLAIVEISPKYEFMQLHTFHDVIEKIFGSYDLHCANASAINFFTKKILQTGSHIYLMVAIVVICVRQRIDCGRETL
jgi:hypothetical protein